MACSKYSLTNTGTTAVNFNYRRCDDVMWQYQVNLDPNQTKNIWLIDGTYDAAQIFESSISLVNDGVYPPTPTPTPTNTTTPTPTSSVTPTPSITPTNTVTPTTTTTQTPTTTSTPTNTTTPTTTNTQTPTITPTNTQTPTITPTNTQTPTITPTNTQTPSVTPTNTMTPSITPTNTPTPSATPIVETIQIANSTWGSLTQQQFRDFLFSGGTNNNNPNVVVTSFTNNAGDITAGVYNLTNLNITFLVNFTSITQLPNSLTSLSVGYSNITSLPSLPTSLTFLFTEETIGLTSLPPLPPSLETLVISKCSFTTASLDSAVDTFILGTTPKAAWNSATQTTGQQPSPAKVALLNANVSVVQI